MKTIFTDTHVNKLLELPFNSCYRRQRLQTATHQEFCGTGYKRLFITGTKYSQFPE